MAQLGSGLGTHFSSAIDTRQTYQNGLTAVPDSDTRVDAEVLNDSLAAIVQIETVLGAGVQGAYASVAARLAALETGAPALTNVVAFTSQTSVTVPGSAHQQGQQALLYQVYDASTPRQALQPETFSVYPGSFDAVVTFEAPQSGVIMVGALTPQYQTTFTNQDTVTVPGATHALTQAYLFFQVFDLNTPARAIEVASMRVNTTTRDVTVTFGTAQSGTLLLSVGTPRFTQAFTNQTSVTVLGSAHGLASGNLLSQVYDASTDPNAIQAGSLTVHPSTFDVVLTFAAPQSGTLVLAPVPTVTPPVLFAVLPLTQAVPVPVRGTPLAASPAPAPTSDADTARLQRTVLTLTTRLETLEMAYQVLLTQRDDRTQEVPPT